MRTRARLTAVLTLAAALGAAAFAGPAAAQGIRGELVAIASYIEYPVLVRDSLPEIQVPGDGTTRKLPDGTVVTCIPGGYCYWYRSGPEQHTTPIREDLSLTGWPGWQGVSGRLHLRGRFGSDSFWPRSTKDIETLNAYVDFDRPAFRVRGGRQDKGGGLGYYYFDGVDLLWKARTDMRVEAYAGRSLARTLLESDTGSLLRDAEQLSPDKPAILLGVEGRYRYHSRLSASLLYQRELRTDRGGLYSERMAFDSRWAPPAFTANLSLDFDVAEARFHEAWLKVGRPVVKNVDLALEGRYYRPFLELWTIWGAFTPVGYSEYRAEAFWTVKPGLKLNAAGGWRQYEDTHAGVNFAPVEGTGYRAHLSASWERDPWNVAGLASVAGGYGAFRSNLDASAGRRFAPDRYLGVFASGTQQFAEFRFGEGTTRGAGVEGRAGFGRAVDLNARLGLYRHTFENRPGFDDYNQVRGEAGLRWRFGSEPAAAGESRPGERAIP